MGGGGDPPHHYRAPKAGPPPPPPFGTRCGDEIERMHWGGGGAAHGLAELHVRLYLALLLAQFLKHLWLLL